MVQTVQLWGRTATRRVLNPAISRLDRHINRLARSGARQVTDETRSELRELRAEVSRLRGSLNRAQADLTSVRSDLDRARADVAALTASGERLRPLAESVALLLGPDGRAKTRIADEALITALATQVERVTGTSKGRASVVPAFRLLLELESRGVGRVAGEVQNVLGKLATTPLLVPPNGEILEIGTLYGIFAAGMARQLDRIGLEHRITVVDPFTGGQLQKGTSRPDASGSPVTEAVARINLRLAGVSADRVRMIQGYSEDPAVQSAISDREYGVMIIDGDHSAAGVAVDLVLAEKVMAPRGIVVIDDYGDPKWAGVTEATSAHLAGETRFDLVGVVATSAFLRAR